MILKTGKWNPEFYCSTILQFMSSYHEKIYCQLQQYLVAQLVLNDQMVFIVSQMNVYVYSWYSTVSCENSLSFFLVTTRSRPLPSFEISLKFVYHLTNYSEDRLTKESKFFWNLNHLCR